MDIGAANFINVIARQEMFVSRKTLRRIDGPARNALGQKQLHPFARAAGPEDARELAKDQIVGGRQ
jgi:hypothetical protein